MENTTGVIDPGITPVIDPMVVAGMTDAALLSELDAAFARRRIDDAVIARLSGEVAERSRSELGGDGLARRSGHSTAPTLIASIGRIGNRDAARYCRVGSATAPRFSIAGEKLPPLFESLALGMDAGLMTVEAAAHIIAHLNLARSRAGVENMIAAENALVDYASLASADDVRKVAVAWRDHLDTDGIEPRESELIAARSLKRFWLPNGLKRFQWDLDPTSAAYLDAVVDAETAAAFRRVRFTDRESETEDPAPPSEDPRTASQIGADAMVDLARHVLSCENTTPALATTTVLVRMTLDQLSTGTGAATIGVDEQPISAGTARRLAADADIIPAVLGGQSEILDLGRRRRMYSKAQKLALLERDGGCICGCDRPPVYLEAHHTRWWKRDRGETNLKLGVMVCSKAHTMIHQHGWDVRFIDNAPYLIPPPTIDPRQRPRRGGRPPMPHRRM